jgi:hypothetical protein
MAEDIRAWLIAVKNRAQDFLAAMRGETVPGFHRYSISGDLHGERVRWGLGNTVFAVKSHYSIGALNDLPQSVRDSMASFIMQFQDEQGVIFDPLVERKAMLKNMVHAVRSGDFKNMFGRLTKVAETRQAMCALRLLGCRPQRMFAGMPRTVEELQRYLSRFDWSRPWSTGSHFSHAMFFYEYNSEVFGYEPQRHADLIAEAERFVNELQSPRDGAWYRGDDVPVQQKINGAMKVLTGLRAAGIMRLRYPERLIDLVLSAKDGAHACDNFNAVYVLKCADEATQGTYRHDEIRAFCLKKLADYRRYYHPEHGGFSFFPERSNTTYYGARIARGLNEPDIHGTCLFLWGIAVLAQLLGYDDLGFREHDA